MLGTVTPETLKDISEFVKVPVTSIVLGTITEQAPPVMSTKELHEGEVTVKLLAKVIRTDEGMTVDSEGSKVT